MSSAQKHARSAFSNYQQFRALLGFLGLSHKAAALELGVAPNTLSKVAACVLIPDEALKERIRVMSLRWPHGAIEPSLWPVPLLDRRHSPLKKRGAK